MRATCLAGVLAENGYGESQGAVSTAEWMRHQFKLSTHGAHDLVNVGLEMSSLEASSEAAFDGEIGFQHLAVLARAKRQLGGRRFKEEHLLAEAKECSVGRLWWRCQELRHACDPEGVEQEQLDHHARRALRITHHQDGRVGLSGILDAVSGAVVESAIAPLAKKTGRDDERNLEQRTADALAQVCDHAMGQGRLRERPHLNVTATMGTVFQIPQSPAAATEQGALLAGVTVKRIACDCSVGRYVFGSDSVLIDMGRTARVVSGAQRRALVQRDQHCRGRSPQAGTPDGLHAAGQLVRGPPRGALDPRRAHRPGHTWSWSASGTT